METLQQLRTYVEEGDMAGVVRAIAAHVPLHDPGNRWNALVACAVHNRPAMVPVFLAAGADLDAGLDDATPLSAAARHNRVPMVKKLLEEGANVDAEDGYGQTPLAAAAGAGHAKVVRMLLDAGANPDGRPAEDEDDWDNELIPIVTATKNGHAHIIPILLEGGADINACSGAGPAVLHATTAKVVYALAKGEPDWDATSDRDDHLRTAMTQAAGSRNAELVRAFVRAGVDVDAGDGCGTPPIIATFNEYCAGLSEATDDECAAVLEVLVEAGANLDFVDTERNDTALNLAVESGFEKCVHILLKAGARVTVEGARSPALVACSTGECDTALLSELVEAGAALEDINYKGNTALLEACEDACLSKVAVLLKAGARVTHVNSVGNTALHQAVMHNYGGTSEDVALEKVAALLQAGADLNARNTAGETPFICAMHARFGKAALFLLQAGADVTPPATCPFPHHIAAASGLVDILRLLLERSFLVDACGEDGITALMRATEAGEVAAAEFLLRADANIHAKDALGRTPIICAASQYKADIFPVLLQWGANLSDKDARGRTPFLLQSDHDMVEGARLLFEAGADVNVCDVDGTTPLMCWSSRSTREQTMRHEYNGQQMVPILLGAGAQLDAVDSRGMSALCRAAAGGFEAIATQLVHAGADVHRANGTTALSFVIGVHPYFARGHGAIASLLAAGARIDTVA